MAVPVYIVEGPRVGAVPVMFSSARDAQEVVVVGGSRSGAQPVYIAGMREPGVTIVRLVQSARITGGTLGSSASPLSGPAIVTSSLLVEYRFDDSSGTTLTDYAGGFNGTLGTGAADRPDWVSAGLDFVPANADVVINSTMPDTNVLGAVTICVVANIDTGAAFREFCSKCLTSGALNNPFEFRTSNAATPILILIRSHATDTKIWNGPAVTLGGYQMYSAVSPTDIGAATTFYIGNAATGGVNGGGSGTGPATGAGANLRLGRRADGAVQMDGVMAYMLIYSRALSVGEIATNYAALQSYLTPRGVVLP
jgi:hypothetical protein